MPATILEMGSVLMAWRHEANCSYANWAGKLWQKSFRLALNREQLARDLQTMEERDLWPYDDDVDALMQFAHVCRRALVSNPAQHTHADKLLRVVMTYIAASRLGVDLITIPPPYSAAQWSRQRRKLLQLWRKLLQR